MNKSIKTYDELLKRQEQLEVLLKAQAELVRYDFAEVKDAAIDSLSSAGKVFTRNTGSLLLMGTANRLIDLVVKRGILGRAGWVTKMVIPFLMKNFSSHYIADHKQKWVSKLFSWIGKKSQNGYDAPAPTPKDDVSRN